MALSNSETLTFDLRIGLVHDTPGWSALLEQIGVWYETVDFSASDLLPRYSVIIVNGPIGRTELQFIKAYLERGGAILDTGPYTDFITNNSLVHKKTDQILPHFEGPFAHVGRIDIHQTVRGYKAAQYLDRTVKLPDAENPRFAFLGWDVDQAMGQATFTRKTFPAGSNPLQPNELASKVSKGPIRRTITLILKVLHKSRNLPFVHLWPLPSGHQHFFGFRIDTDYGTKESLQNLKRFGETHQLRMSWFVHVEAHEEWLDYFHTLSDSQEIASHGFYHYTYSSFEKNHENIKRARQLLSASNFDIKGFCAPYGVWNRGLQRALEDLDVLYSSEFTFDYDNLPSYPILEEKASKALQIPIHPLGIGRLQHAGASRLEMEQYLQQIINLQFSRHEPVFFYHHPNQTGLKQFSKVLRSLSDRNYCNWTMGEYATWWEKRQRFRLQPKYRQNKLWFEQSTPPSTLSVGIFTDENTYSTQRPTQTIYTDTLNQRTFAPEIPVTVQQQFKESYYRWSLLKTSFLDFIHRLNY